MITTKDLDKENPPAPVKISDADKIAKLKDMHAAKFKALDVDADVVFIPRNKYKKNDVLVVGYYPSHIKRVLDKGYDTLYTMCVDRNYEIENGDANLYSWKINPHYRSDYMESAPHLVSGDKQVLIPFSEFTVISEQQKMFTEPPVQEVITDELKFEIPDPELDEPLAKMTIKDFMAIIRNIPVSNKEWLNELIIKNKPIK